MLTRISFFVYDPVLLTFGRILGIQDRLTEELLLTQDNTHTHTHTHTENDRVRAMNEI